MRLHCTINKLFDIEEVDNLRYDFMAVSFFRFQQQFELVDNSKFDDHGNAITFGDINNIVIVLSVSC